MNRHTHTHALCEEAQRTCHLFGSFYATLRIQFFFICHFELFKQAERRLAVAVAVAGHMSRISVSHTLSYDSFLFVASRFRVNCCRFKK